MLLPLLGFSASSYIFQASFLGLSFPLDVIPSANQTSRKKRVWFPFLSCSVWLDNLSHRNCDSLCQKSPTMEAFVLINCKNISAYIIFSVHKDIPNISLKNAWPHQVQALECAYSNGSYKWGFVITPSCREGRLKPKMGCRPSQKQNNTKKLVPTP